MKRFSETNKWEDPWFRKLKPKYKTFLIYLFDRCDNVGVWVVDMDLAATYVGEKIDSKEAIKAFDGRVVEIGKGKWLIPQFVTFQYGTLSAQCHPHKRILELLSKHSLEVGKDGKTTLPGRVVTTLEDKDKEEEKEEDKEEEKEGGIVPISPDLEFPQNLRTEAFFKTWEEWVGYRKSRAACKDWIKMFQKQLEWLGSFPEGTARAMLDQSIRNNWQSIQEIKNGNSNHQSSSGYNRPTTSQQRNSVISGADRIAAELRAADQAGDDLPFLPG